MTDESTFHICELCRERIEPEASRAVRAVELIDAGTFGPDENEPLEGLGVFFHERCWPGDGHGYRRTD